MYKFREVQCPFCKHKYMFQILGSYDAEIDGDNRLSGWYSACPECQNDVFVVENQLEGIDLEKIPEDTIKRSFELK